MSLLLKSKFACRVMSPRWDICFFMTEQEVLSNGLSFFSDGMSLLRVPPHLSFPASYRFTTRQMAVIWEVLRWAHFIALLMHSHKQQPPLLSFSHSPSPSVLYSPSFYSLFLFPGSISPSPFSRHPILSPSTTEQMCPHTLAHTYASLTVSHWSQTQALWNTYALPSSLPFL